MNLRDITDKLKDTIIQRDVKKEGLEPDNSEKKEIVEDENMEYEQKPISDEFEQSMEQPIKIKTVFVKSGEEEEGDKKKKIAGAVKIAAGVGIVAAGLAAFVLGSRKKK